MKRTGAYRGSAVLSSRRCPALELALAVLLLVPVCALASAIVGDSADTSSLDSPVDTETIRLPVVEGKDIRFARISSSQGLSEVRVSDIVQDDQGFIWFGTWNGLNRYDGYNFKVFKHDPERQESLSGVFIYSLFKDRAGTIWVGTDQSLDRFDPLTETFSHYHFDVPDSSGLPTTVDQISQDSPGMLWLSTRKGLFRLDPVTGKTKHFYHDPGDPSSLGDNAIKSTGEDRTGRFWVGTSQTLDELDRNTGKVKRHVLTGESGIGLWFHEDRFGVFWIVYGPDGSIATFDPKTNKLTRYGFDSRGPESNLKNPAYALLEDHEGTMWFGTAVLGLLKFDREHRRFISYHHLPGDSDSLVDNRVIALFEDREKNIWVGMHDVAPHFFATRPQPFTKLTNPSDSRNSISPGLVGALYQDRQGVLWVGVNRSLVRIDRKTGLSSGFQPVAGSEVVSIIEDGPDVLWIAGTNPLLRYNRRTGELRRYIHDRSDPSTLCSGVVQRLLIDHRGTLWAATWDGLCRFDPLIQRFTTYKPDPKTRGLNYYAIAEDSQGNLWLGGNLGLHRFDPNTDQFTVYSHKSDDPHSLSDNRVVAIYFDRAGSMWVGTQNGLDKFDPRTRTFAVYSERNGMGGNVVSCILEDQRGLLWMSTNKGVSSFDPRTQKFSNYTMADGLPGPDLTGWGACFKSAAGEMFFGGFSGVTAFFPDKVVADAVVANAFVPPIVLTDFQLFGRPVTLSPGSPLKKAVNYTDTITLSHSQNIFSIGFSALSFFNPATNRYRYMLEELDQKWNEVGSEQRLASYTTLPAGTYMFHVQGASRRGPWSEPGAQLRIQILPPWWNTWWFRALWATTCLALLWGLYRVRIQGLRRQEKKLRAVIETMPTFAWTALPDGSVDFANRHWQEYTALSTEETVGSGWETAVHPEDVKRYAEKWRAAVASGEPFENEVRFRRAADAQYRWFLTRAVPLRDARGKILKWYGTSTDIEDRKRAEELQAELAHTNRVSTMGELVASISHELAQPITVTTANAKASLRWLQRDPPDMTEVRKGTERIIEAGTLASEIINRLRSLYKKSSPKRELVAINEVIGEMVLLLRGEANEYAVSIRTGLAADLPKITADRVQLQQVLMNLMLNGIEAMKETGGVLTVKTEPGEGGQVQTSVSDTGVGLPAETADEIFNAFFTTKPQGSGMGLAISRSIVESHSGRIWANADSGRGATFHFTLPAAPTETNLPVDAA
jgi:PAS domain S-box-containing protein